MTTQAHLPGFQILQASDCHVGYAEEISSLLAASAKERGIGRGGRPTPYLAEKMRQGHAIIAIDEKQNFAGFSFIDVWQNDEFVANAGFIVANQFRGQLLGRHIKIAAFKLARQLYPDAKVFGITTSPAVLHLNNALGYLAVPYSELPKDINYWQGCKSCPFFDVLQRTSFQRCLCTAMVYDPTLTLLHGSIKG